MTDRLRVKTIVALFLFLFALSQLAEGTAFSQTEDVPRITVHELKDKMDKGEDVMIVDSRSGKDYERSKIKIKGAVRIPLVHMEDRSGELSADKEIIIYCT